MEYPTLCIMCNRSALSKEERTAALIAIQSETFEALQTQDKYLAFAGLDQITVSRAAPSLDAALHNALGSHICAAALLCEYSGDSSAGLCWWW